MRDAIGNKISEGDLVKWLVPPATLDRMIFQVVRASDGGIVTPEGITPPMIQLSITLPIESMGAEPVLGEFLCVRNPQSEKLLDALSNAGEGRKPS
jgi:hypothetical protein